MNVEVVDGRKSRTFRKSTKVLVDIFRSTSTIPVMFRRGVASVKPTSSVRSAKQLKREHPEYLVVGERYGLKVPGFDMNNSPHDAMEADLEGKTVIFTSTNGTMVLKRISSMGKIYISSFVNVTATCEKLKDLDTVDIVVSNRPDGQADEDYLYADFLKATLLGQAPDFEEYADKIKNSKGARRLKLLGARKDIEASLQKDFSRDALIYDGEYIVRE